MNVVTTLTKEQFSLFKAMGVIIDNEYFHLPQYFKSLGVGEFQIMNYDELPEDVKELTLQYKKQLEKR